MEEIYYRHERVDYQEVVIAEKDGIVALDCQLEGKTVLVRIEHRDRPLEPNKHKLHYSKEAIVHLLSTFKAEDF